MKQGLPYLSFSSNFIETSRHRASERRLQRLEKEERELKRVEKLRLKEEEKMKEEIDLYERGLSAR